MKKIITLIAAAALCACGGKDAAYKNALPKDAAVVVGIKMDQLGRKINAKDFQTGGIAQLLRADSKLSADQNELIISLLANPKESGLSTMDDVYLFYVPGESQTKSLGAVARVEDRKKIDEVVAKAGFTVTEKDGRTFVSWEENADEMLAYDNETFISFESNQPSDNVQTMIEGLFTQTEGYFAANKAAAATLNGSDDICAVMSYNKLMDAVMAGNPLLNSVSPTLFEDMYKGVLLAVTGNFEKGSLVVNTKPIYTDKETEKKILDLTAKMVGKNINGKVLKLIPEDAIFAMAMNLKGAGMYEVLSAESELQKTLTQVPMAKGIFEAIEGDMVFALTSADSKIPQGAIFVELAKPDVITGYAAMAASIGAKAVEGAENQFIFAYGDIEVHFGVKDNTLYATNDPRVVAAMGGEKIASVAGNSIFSKGPAAGFVNFVALRGITNFMKSVNEEMKPFIEALASLEFSASPDGQNSRIELKMTDTSTNAAEVFYTLINALTAKEAAEAAPATPDVAVEEEVIAEEAA